MKVFNAFGKGYGTTERLKCNDAWAHEHNFFADSLPLKKSHKCMSRLSRISLVLSFSSFPVPTYSTFLYQMYSFKFFPSLYSRSLSQICISIHCIQLFLFAAENNICIYAPLISISHCCQLQLISDKSLLQL